MSKKGSGRTPEQQRKFMRDYMKSRREGTWNRKNAGGGSVSMATVKRSEAEYDPQRDGKRFHDSITAVMMGDPPVGQRAIDRGQT